MLFGDDSVVFRIKKSGFPNIIIIKPFDADYLTCLDHKTSRLFTILTGVTSPRGWLSARITEAAQGAHRRSRHFTGIRRNTR